MDLELVEKFALSLGLGLLVGFQREWTAPHVAGVRTFALLTLFGTLCGVFAKSVSVWTIPAGLFVTAGLLVVGTFIKWDEEDDTVGLTTHVAACLMFLIGAALIFLPMELPVLLAGAVAVLLHWKI